MDDEKSGAPVLTDRDIMGEKVAASHDESMHWGALNEEELAIETKLKRRIDFVIMPCVIAVYLMNYIDRYVQLNNDRDLIEGLMSCTEITTRPQNYKDWSRI